MSRHGRKNNQGGSLSIPPSKTDFSFLEGGGYSKIFDWVVFEGGYSQKNSQKKPKMWRRLRRAFKYTHKISIMLSDYNLMHTYTHSINKLY